MSDMKFTEDHEWIRIEGDGNGTVGITDHAQQQLGDLVYVELPEVGTQAVKGEEIVVIESVKAAGGVKAPVAGTVIAVNQAVADDPALVNQDATGEGWFFKIEIADPGELEGLMDEAGYNSLIEG
jgi:glycine cleavage system H protein